MKPERLIPAMFFVLWTLLMVGHREGFLNDPAIFRQVRTGELILAERELPVLDRYSVSAFGEAWRSRTWLADVAMAGFSRIGGEDSLVLAAATIVALLFSWLFMRFLLGGFHPLGGVILVGLLYGCASSAFFAGPGLFDLIGLALTGAALVTVETGKSSPRALLRLLPVFIVWANLSGEAAVGLIALGFVLFGWLVNPLFKGVSPVRDQPRSRWIELLMIGIALGASILANPSGIALIGDWGGLTGSPAARAAMGQFFPAATTAHGWPMILLGIVFFGFTAGWGSLGFSPVRSLPLVWLALTWVDGRHAAGFAVLAGTVLAIEGARVGWGQQATACGVPLFCNADSAWRDQIATGWRRCSMAALVLVVIGLACQWTGAVIPVFGRHWVKLDERRWPVDLIPRIQAWAGGKPPGEPIFNDPRFGGFLIGNVPRVRVFVDDRWELYQDKRLSDFVNAARDTAPLDRWERGFNFTGALVVPGTPFDGWFKKRQGWRLVGQTPVAVWYEKP